MGTEPGRPTDNAAPSAGPRSYQNDSSLPLKTAGLIIELEIGIVILVTLLGAGIRFWGITQMGMSHFDAGIYAQSGLWPWTGAFHFQQGYYSPPLYPLLIGVVNFLAGGPVDWAGTLISVLAGTALIPVCWWTGRSWFGPGAGLLTAFLVSIDGLQIIFSRVGLTDELFTLFFVAGLAAVRSAIDHGGWRRILLTGLLVGLAWNTKYNGFLPLALGAGFLFDHPFVRRATRLALTSLVSLTLYLPWALWFHVEHGYQTLIAHQRGYFHGLTGAAGNWAEFLHDMDIVATPTLGIGIILLLLTTARSIRGWGLLALAILGLIASAIELFGWPWMIWLPLAYFGAWRAEKWSRRFGFIWILTWLLILPALYTPYLRLWLPTEAVVLLLASAGLVELADLKGCPSNAESRQDGRLIQWLPVTIGLFLVLFLLPLGASARFRFWLETSYRPHEGYKQKGLEHINYEFLSFEGIHVFSLARPPLNYLLQRSLEELRSLKNPSTKEMFVLSGDPLNLNEIGPDSVLVVDRTLLDTPSFQSTFDAAMGRMNHQVLGPIDPDVVTLLDDYHGANLRRDLPSFLQTYRVFLFRPKSGNGPARHHAELAP